ncbi:hypothetical protein KRX51_06865 [Corynebacterium sp. TAE3-ERU12]|uniref:hypothetical protein n=1 Tax=Corynebacterium sp. TAE3-ERU12 TaxID=2849491 RepID=UPI001C43DE3D|nr:hypothetical protein [Corynebacterium sp. TAE3-ERU12]MBV7295638.1 hypothetical protein [Corynebacterium sp. TAE3-ERU12]
MDVLGFLITWGAGILACVSVGAYLATVAYRESRGGAERTVTLASSRPLFTGIIVGIALAAIVVLIVRLGVLS